LIDKDRDTTDYSNYVNNIKQNLLDCIAASHL